MPTNYNNPEIRLKFIQKVPLVNSKSTPLYGFFLFNYTQFKNTMWYYVRYLSALTFSSMKLFNTKIKFLFHANYALRAKVTIHVKLLVRRQSNYYILISTTSDLCVIHSKYIHYSFYLRQWNGILISAFVWRNPFLEINEWPLFLM